MAKHWFPVFSDHKCVQCGSCVSICPAHVLIFETALKPDKTDTSPILTNPDLCRPNCFECVKVCKSKAVGIIRPAKPCDCCSF